MRFTLLLACLSLHAQTFSATYRPLEIKVSEAMIGSREYGLWTVEIKQLNPAGGMITAKDIMDAGEINATPIPFIADAELARDLIQNRVYLSRPAKAGRVLTTAKTLAGPGLAAAGLAGVPNAGWVGVGLLAVDLVMLLSKGREPNPEDIIERLLPEKISLAFNETATHTILSAKMRGARVVRVTNNEFRGGPVIPSNALETGGFGETGPIYLAPATQELADERLAKILRARTVSFAESF